MTLEPQQWSTDIAEFWMVTHLSAPSFLIRDHKVADGIDEQTLNDWILNNPSVLSYVVLHKWGSHLPLFKNFSGNSSALRLAKPLSIQAHLVKALAWELHLLHSDLYKDDNHKPEMALALTEFEALCGFLDIKVKEEEEPKEGEEAQPEEEKKTEKKIVSEKYWDGELANDTKPLWMQNPKEIQKEDYQEFYKKGFQGVLGSTYLYKLHYRDCSTDPCLVS